MRSYSKYISVTSYSKNSYVCGLYSSSVYYKQRQTHFVPVEYSNIAFKTGIFVDAIYCVVCTVYVNKLDY